MEEKAVYHFDPEYSKRRLQSLNNIIMDFHGKEKITERRMELMWECCSDLKRSIAPCYPNIDLEPYGSTVTGFGSKESDADFTFMFQNEMPDEYTEEQVLRNIRELVKKSKFTTDIIYIPARVPIVNLRWKALHVDISLHNTSALRNTEELQRYCSLEPERLPALGFWVKKWAKEFDICSKQRGTLSSYSYILMVIYYLQNTSPRVLPCIHMENWYGTTNKQTVAELFYGFLQFYSNFYFKDQVIQIFTKGDLHRCENERKPMIDVRDCIETGINTTSNVNSQNMKKIVKIFRRSEDSIDRWIHGLQMPNETMRTLFNVH